MKVHLKFIEARTWIHNFTTGESMIEYTVPHDANVIIVDGIRVSRELFSSFGDSANENRLFRLKKSAHGNESQKPVIESIYYDFCETLSVDTLNHDKWMENRFPNSGVLDIWKRIKKYIDSLNQCN